MRILNALRPANSQPAQHIIPHTPVVEGPPLPATVLTPETLDNGCAAWVLVDVACAVQDEGVYYDD